MIKKRFKSDILYYYYLTHTSNLCHGCGFFHSWDLPTCTHTWMTHTCDLSWVCKPMTFPTTMPSFDYLELQMGSARQLLSPNTFKPLRNHGTDQITMNLLDKYSLQTNNLTN